jgi:hypothetical protein
MFSLKYFCLLAVEVFLLFHVEVFSFMYHFRQMHHTDYSHQLTALLKTLCIVNVFG